MSSDTWTRGLRRVRLTSSTSLGPLTSSIPPCPLTTSVTPAYEPLCASLLRTGRANSESVRGSETSVLSHECTVTHKQLELTLTRRRRSTNDDVDARDRVRPEGNPRVVDGVVTGYVQHRPFVAHADGRKHVLRGHTKTKRSRWWCSDFPRIDPEMKIICAFDKLDREVEGRNRQLGGW